jgi:hypothetical protein
MSEEVTVQSNLKRYLIVGVIQSEVATYVEAVSLKEAVVIAQTRKVQSIPVGNNAAEWIFGDEGSEPLSCNIGITHVFVPETDVVPGEPEALNMEHMGSVDMGSGKITPPSAPVPHTSSDFVPTA